MPLHQLKSLRKQLKDGKQDLKEIFKKKRKELKKKKLLLEEKTTTRGKNYY